MNLMKRFPQNETQKKNHSKTHLDETNLPFHDVLGYFVFLYFSTARQAVFALYDKI